MGDVTVQNGNINVAAKVVAQVCGLKVGAVNVLARQVDRSGESVTVCQSNDQPVVISQN